MIRFSSRRTSFDDFDSHERIKMSWYIGAIAKASARNWDLCKEISLFGISTGGRQVGASSIEPGDKLLIWLGGTGYIAITEIVGKARQPIGREEAPWGGGLHRFGLVLPIKVEFEPNAPVWLGFESGKQVNTGMPQFSLRKGFSRINDDVGKVASEIIRLNPDGLKK